MSWRLFAARMLAAAALIAGAYVLLPVPTASAALAMAAAGVLGHAFATRGRR